MGRARRGDARQRTVAERGARARQVGALSTLYVDTSALVRCYAVDEPEHDELRRLLFDGGHAVVTSELTRLELTSAILAAGRAGRVPADALLARFAADVAAGAVALIAFERRLLPAAEELVRAHRLRTLDALQLAAAARQARPVLGEVTLVTRDHEQAEAARALGLDVA